MVFSGEILILLWRFFSLKLYFGFRSQVALGLLRLLGHELCVALEKWATQLTEGVSNMVVRLSHGRGPKFAEVAEMDDWWKLVVKRMEFFFVHLVAAAPAKTGKLDFLLPKTERLVGRPAIDACFLEILHQYEADPASVSLPKLKPLKQYSWMLTEKQEEKRKEMSHAVCSASDLALCDAAEPASGSGAIVPLAGFGGSSDGKKLALKVGVKHDKEKKSEAVANEKVDENDEILRD